MRVLPLRRSVLTLLTLFVVFAACQTAGPDSSDRPPKAEEEAPVLGPQSWQDLDPLIDKRKYSEAGRLAERLLAATRAAGDEEGWTRALLISARLARARGEMDGAVTLLREEEWPTAPASQLLLGLVYGDALVQYQRNYGWEIAQRERVGPRHEIPLDRWTEKQLIAEAHEAFGRAWAMRDGWGAEGLGDLAEHFEAGTYPERIRGTLRDTVSYLWTDLLADSSLWSVGESNALYRFDLDFALGEPAPRLDSLPEDGHPLLKMAAVLRDLERWHTQGERPEAAFEARLVLLDSLRQALDQEAARQTLEVDLQRALDELGAEWPWWSMGMATRAEWVRSGEQPNARTEARALALEAVTVHPKSLGGQRGRSIAESIEAPAYQMNAMAADALGQRSVRVLHKNLPRLYFRAYRLDVDQRLRKMGLDDEVRSGNGYPRFNLSSAEIERVLARRTPAAAWGLELPATPDFRRHATDVTPPMEVPGLYLLVASAREDFREKKNRLVGLTLTLGDLVLLSQWNEGRLELTTRSGSTGQPRRGVEVALFRWDWRDPLKTVGRGATDDRGRKPFSVEEQRGFLAVARHGDEVAVLQDTGDRFDSEERRVERGLVYTDRSVYRPGQTVRFKVVAYGGMASAGRFEVLPERTVSVRLVDANGETAAETAATTNAFGSIAGELEIPAGRLLGLWRLETSLDGSDHPVRVEEYKRPTFEVTVRAPEEPPRLNRRTVLRGEARYYFGLPVSGGEVSWSVTREPQWRPWMQRVFSPADWSSQVVAWGESMVEADGTFGMAFTPEGDESAEGMVYRYRVEAAVTEAGGETRRGERVFHLGTAAIQASLEVTGGFQRSETPFEVDVVRTDLDGAPRAGRGTWSLVSLEQPATARLPHERPLAAEGFQTPDDLKPPRYADGLEPARTLARWGAGREMSSGELHHGDNGRSVAEIPALAPGVYRLIYRTEDPWGHSFEASRDLVVAGRGDLPLALPLFLAAEQTSIEAGETLPVLVHSAFPGQEMELEVKFRNRAERRTLIAGESPTVVEISLPPEARGGVALSLHAVRDHHLLRLDESVLVPWSDRELHLELETFRDRLRPGDRETWTVRLTGADGRLVEGEAAELLAYMYDRSLDLFAPHEPMNPLLLYPRDVYARGVGSNLGLAPTLLRRAESFARSRRPPQLRAVQLKRLAGWYRQQFAARSLFEEVTVTDDLAEVGFAEELVVASAASPPTEQDGRAVFEEGPLEVVGYAPEVSVTTVSAAGSSRLEDIEPRSNFSETAFWLPQLTMTSDGVAEIAVEVPDSVTEWQLWVLALTRDLRAGSVSARTRTIKELQIRPAVPRFLREGDRAVLEVLVDNAGEERLDGEVRVEMVDAESGEPIAGDFRLRPNRRQFRVEAGRSERLSFRLEAPDGLAANAALRVTGRAGDLTDGELRPLPVLPGRIHLAESRFAALQDEEREVLRFPELARDTDATRRTEQLVVTVDGQLFYSALAALPYLVDYPYECTEQTLNRFLSTGILTSLYQRYPVVASAAEEMAERETRLAPWDADDPNRKLTLEETPWRAPAAGGRQGAEELIAVLDPKISEVQREAALARLLSSQFESGAFPWFPGGPPSPYMTLYLMQGFARAAEFGVPVPREPVEWGWGYLRQYYDDFRKSSDDEPVTCCWESFAFLAYILSSYPDESYYRSAFSEEDERRLLEDLFEHRRFLTLRPKLYLALALHRAGRVDEARGLLDVVLDAARSSEDAGVFFAPEDRAWLWYRDTLENHAFVLRALSEMAPEDPRRHGLVQWLFLQRKLSHWKSTRATAEALYALAYYLNQEDALAVREEISVRLGTLAETFVFEADRFEGPSRRLIVSGDEVEPEMAEIAVHKKSPGLAFASATWHFSTERLPEEARGDLFAVERAFFRRVLDDGEWTLQPLSPGDPVAVGDQVEVQLTVRASAPAEYVHLRDPRGAGFEPESLTSGYRWDLGIGRYEEVRDSGANFFFEDLPAGEYLLKHRLRATMTGTFKVAPATLQSMYAPEFTAYSAGRKVEVERLAP
ncbi:MAG: alpha-2-macroglobulin family protein [Acidobacteriota bacterium]